MKKSIAFLTRGPLNGPVFLAALMTVHCSLPASAQSPVGAGAAPQAQAAAKPQYERVGVTAGRSTVVPTDFDVTRIAITDPAIADAVVVQPREILVDGKKAGTVSLIIWGGGTRRQYDIVVEPAITTLEQQLQALFPGEDIKVNVSEEALVLAGTVSSTNVMLRAGEIATASSTKSKIINMLQVPGGSESQQVMLQVRFAEVNRKALTELGLTLFSTRETATARSTTQQFAAPDHDDDKPGGLVFNDYLNLFFFNRKEGIGGVLRALQQRGGFQSLAEPNLIAYNGQEASFLAAVSSPCPSCRAPPAP
jgi:pilus assembly protein CpaC